MKFHLKSIFILNRIKLNKNPFNYNKKYLLSISENEKDIPKTLNLKDLHIKVFFNIIFISQKYYLNYQILKKNIQKIN